MNSQRIYIRKGIFEYLRHNTWKKFGKRVFCESNHEFLIDDFDEYINLEDEMNVRKKEKSMWEGVGLRFV